jgi:hypothetical protein
LVNLSAIGILGISRGGELSHFPYADRSDVYQRDAGTGMGSADEIAAFRHVAR